MAQCLTPIRLKHETNYTPVPCGRCSNCLSRRVSGWSFRLMQEEKRCSSSYFVTLTYSNENIKLTPKKYMNLDKRDIQLFMKRLRKANNNKLKYYLCGEYGTHTYRPHYHLLIFNVNVETLEKAWGLGQLHIGKVQEASVGYTLKYMSKPTRIPMHQNDDRQKEFSLMSKGLGKGYLTNAIIKWHKEDLINRVYCPLTEGKKAPMPRYYKEKIYNRDEKGSIKAHYSQKYTEELIELAYSQNLNSIMHARKETIKADKRRLAFGQNRRNNN